jgi:hypothetical protein
MSLGKTRRQLRRKTRGWSFSPSSSKSSLPELIRNLIPFQSSTRTRKSNTSSSSHSAWRTISSKRGGTKRKAKRKATRKAKRKTMGGKKGNW